MNFKITDCTIFQVPVRTGMSLLVGCLYAWHGPSCSFPGFLLAVCPCNQSNIHSAVPGSFCALHLKLLPRLDCITHAVGGWERSETARDKLKEKTVCKLPCIMKKVSKKGQGEQCNWHQGSQIILPKCQAGDNYNLLDYILQDGDACACLTHVEIAESTTEIYCPGSCGHCQKLIHKYCSQELSFHYLGASCHCVQQNIGRTIASRKMLVIFYPSVPVLYATFM